MAAHCYWCADGKTTIPKALGSLGDPLGCCKKCYVLACGHHGQRDPKMQLFQCIDCDPKLLAASAQALVDAEADSSTVERRGIMKVKLIYDYQTEDNLFNSFNEFRLRRPGYGHWLDEIESLHLGLSPLHVGDYFDRWPFEAQLLLLAAAYLLARTSPDTPLDDQGYAPIVEQLKKIVHDHIEGGQNRYPAY
jgi:hypothetical protein